MRRKNWQKCVPIVVSVPWAQYGWSFRPGIPNLHVQTAGPLFSAPSLPHSPSPLQHNAVSGMCQSLSVCVCRGIQRSHYSMSPQSVNRLKLIRELQLHSLYTQFAFCTSSAAAVLLLTCRCFVVALLLEGQIKSLIIIFGDDIFPVSWSLLVAQSYTA